MHLGKQRADAWTEVEPRANSIAASNLVTQWRIEVTTIDIDLRQMHSTRFAKRMANMKSQISRLCVTV